jgi:deoxycytidylate deaminase
MSHDEQAQLDRQLHMLGITPTFSGQPQRRGPCAKQVVVAVVITRDNKAYVGRNDVNNAQQVCPRVTAGMKTGEGYELCKTVCQQPDHAEVAAIKAAVAAGSLVSGSTMFIYGHTYACEPCLSWCREYGVERVVFGGVEVRP